VRTYHTVEYYRLHYITARALILIGPSGPSFLLKPHQNARGKYALVGIIE
jgi:hypothetical protein